MRMDLRPQPHFQQEQEHAVPRDGVTRESDADLQRKRDLSRRALPRRSIPNQLAILLILGSLLGCQSKTIPNPNDPRDVGTLQPEILRRNLRSVTETLGERYSRGEFNEDRYRQLVTKAAGELVQQIDPSDVDPGDAWQYGEVFRDA